MAVYARVSDLYGQLAFTATNTVTVTLNVGNASAAAAGVVTANPDTFTSAVAGRVSVAGPGVLANDTSSTNLALTAALTATGIERYRDWQPPQRKR